MRDYINLSEFGTFDNLIYDMPVKIWANQVSAKVRTKQNDYAEIQYFKWFSTPGFGLGINNTILKSGIVGFVEDMHLNQVWIESGWMFIILE